MTSALIIVGLVLIVGFVITMAIRNARREGKALQRAQDISAGAEAESEIHQVQAERRDPDETKRRLDDGSF